MIRVISQTAAGTSAGAGGPVAIANVTGLQSALNLLQASATAATDSELSAAVATLQAGIDGSATDADLTGAVNTINTSLAAKQDASSAATDTELASAVSTINTSLGAKQPLALEGTKAAMPVANTVPAKTVYFANDENGGTCYRSDGVTSTASPAGWTKVSPGVLETGGRRLNYAAAASTFSQVAAVQNTDYTLIDTFTVTVGARPILLRGVCPSLTFSVASSNLALRLYEGATQLQSASWGSPATASRGFAGFVEVLLSPSAGDHTYKMTVRASNAAGDISSISGATAPMFLVAVEQ